MKFFKYHSLGNDYILLDSPQAPPALAPEDIRMLCDRHLGIGADGILVIRPSDRAQAAMTDYNPDGSEADVSGNGIRCLAKHLYETGACRQREMMIETRSGLRKARLQVAFGAVHGVEVNMGRPDFRRAAIPMQGDEEEALGITAHIDGADLELSCLSVGTPHCILFLPAIDDSMVSDLGPRLEHHPLFPLGVNVEFAQVKDISEIRLRSWERGAGPTMSSAAGASAVVAAGVREGRCKNLVHVLMPGGLMEVELDRRGELLTRAGARRVFRGELDDDWRERARIFIA
jgi:diaminopimelate epimerase